jgi:hypothetical protein
MSTAVYHGYMQLPDAFIQVDFISAAGECGALQDGAFVQALTSTESRPSVFFHKMARAGVFINTFLNPTKLLQSFEDQGVEFNYLEIGVIEEDTLVDFSAYTVP